MANGQLMTLDEKFAIGHEALALKQAGDIEGYERLMRTMPMPHYLAKVYKDKLGLDVLLSLGWNLSEAEAEYGSDWLLR
jgi:hypothetical protein